MRLIVSIKAQPKKLLRDQHEDDSAGQLQHTHTHTYSATHLYHKDAQNRPGRMKERQGNNGGAEKGKKISEKESLSGLSKHFLAVFFETQTRS